MKPGRLRSCSRAVLSNEQLQRTEEIILQILREEELRQEGWMCMVAALFLQFAGIVCRACPASRREENDRSLKFRRILNYLDEHSGRTIRLDTLAADFGLSKSSLLRMFREMLGTSPIDHLLNLRLEKGRADCATAVRASSKSPSAAASATEIISARCSAASSAYRRATTANGSSRRSPCKICTGSLHFHPTGDTVCNSSTGGIP